MTDVARGYGASAQDAIAAAVAHGNALLKVISANDVGETGAHQSGFYLPKPHRHVFTSLAPLKGVNAEEVVEVEWHDRRITVSRVKWYGRGTRAEYRLTRFGPGFPYVTPEYLGDLLVLVPVAPLRFKAFVVRGDDEVETVQAALGVTVAGTVGVFKGGEAVAEPVDVCLERQFSDFCATLQGFPPSHDISAAAIRALLACDRLFSSSDPDRQLLLAWSAEYDLFRALEHRLFFPRVAEGFRTLEGFLELAQTVLQRRRARAGKALEHHVAYLLKKNNVPFEPQPQIVGRPDIIIPSVAAYADRAVPRDRVIVLALKTTCKDRWRQVLEEAPGVPIKHLLTLQTGISVPQVEQMKAAGVQLVVPVERQRAYPVAVRENLLSVHEFIELCARLAA